MMAGNPNWWSMGNGMHPHDHQNHHLSSSSSSSSQFASFPPNSSSPNSISDQHPAAEFPVRSWSQLLLGGLTGGEDERYGANLFQQQKKLENWEDQVLNLNPSVIRVSGDDVKQESGAGAVPHQSSFPHGHGDDEFPAVGSISSNCWPPHHHMPLVSSPSSCITNNILNFSSSAKSASKNPDPSSECNSGVPSKKPRVQHSSAQPALKVRKEKLGDRITALHQLVSPFGKTDTASVLSEAIGYIRFLQGQIEALSSPYMRNGGGGGGGGGGGSTQHQPHQHSFSNDICVERGVPKKDGSSSDLRSRGLCLVPMSCTQHMPNDGGGADYWAPPGIGGGGF